MKLAQVLIVVLVGVCWVHGQESSTPAPAETTPAPAETTVAPTETTAAPTTTTAAPRTCRPRNARCNPQTDTCCMSNGQRLTCRRVLGRIYRCRV